MGIIADVHFLRKHGVYKMVRLPVPRLTEQYPDANEYYFFTRPTFQLVDLIMEAIRCNLAHSSSLPFLPFVPPSLLLLHLCPPSLLPFLPPLLLFFSPPFILPSPSVQDIFQETGKSVYNCVCAAEVSALCDKVSSK